MRCGSVSFSGRSDGIRGVSRRLQKGLARSKRPDVMPATSSSSSNEPYGPSRSRSSTMRAAMARPTPGTRPSVSASALIHVDVMRRCWRRARTPAALRRRNRPLTSARYVDLVAVLHPRREVDCPGIGGRRRAARQANRVAGAGPGAHSIQTRAAHCARDEDHRLGISPGGFSAVPRLAAPGVTRYVRRGLGRHRKRGRRRMPEGERRQPERRRDDEYTRHAAPFTREGSDRKGNGGWRRQRVR